MEKLNDQDKNSIGGADRGSHARDPRRRSRESSKLTTPRSKRQCEQHARSQYIGESDRFGGYGRDVWGHWGTYYGPMLPSIP